MNIPQPSSEHFDNPDETIRLLVERLHAAEASEARLALEVKMLRTELADLQGRHRMHIHELLKSVDREILPPLESLPSEQRIVLQTLQGLSSDDLTEAERQLAFLVGQPVNANFTKNLTSILTEKQWSVICSKCGTPSHIHWQSSTRHKATGGQLRVAHEDPENKGRYVQHVCVTKIPHFKLVKRVLTRWQSKQSEE